MVTCPSIFCYLFSQYRVLNRCCLRAFSYLLHHVFGTAVTTVCMAGDRFPSGAEITPFFTTSRPTSSLTHCVAEATSLVMKQSEREADSSLHIVQRVRMRGSYVHSDTRPYGAVLNHTD